MEHWLKDSAGRRPERPAVVKTAFRLIPFLFVLYMIAYLDRVNVGFAALQMNEDLRFSAEVYGLGSGIFFLGYFLFEIPSNLILERIGARIWIARIMVTWGVIASATAFIQKPMDFYVIRFLLGLAEAGFFPGMILYLTYWFPAVWRARMIALFMTATALSGVVGGPVSAVLLSLHQVAGLAGWQWVFLLEGLPAVVFGVVVFFYLPEGPEKAKWLTEEEKSALLGALAGERKEVEDRYGHTSILQAMKSGKVWLLTCIYFSITIALYSISVWLPLIVKDFSGLDNFKVAVVSAIPFLVASLGMVAAAILSDRTGHRRLIAAASLCIGALGLGLSAQAGGSHPLLKMAALSLAALGVWGVFGPFWAIPAGFLSGSAAAAGIALVNSVGNLGGFAGPYLMGAIKSRTGSYDEAFVIIALVLLAGAVTVLFTWDKSRAG